METEQFEALMMYVLVGGLMLFMFFIIWDLAKKSKAGRIDARYVDELLERHTAQLIVELGEHVERFVQYQQAQLLRRRLGHAARGCRAAIGGRTRA